MTTPARQRAQRRTNAMRRLDTLVRQGVVPMHVYVALRASILQDPRFFETVELRWKHGHLEQAFERVSRDVQFFLEHACGPSPECAIGLAHAEAYAQDHGWEVGWEHDPEGWFDAQKGLSKEDLAEVSDVVRAVLYDTNAVERRQYKTLASTGGISEGHDYDLKRAWRRIVAAELAMDAMP